MLRFCCSLGDWFDPKFTEFSTVSDVEPLYSSSEQAVFIHLLFFNLSSKATVSFISIVRSTVERQRKPWHTYLIRKRDLRIRMSYHTLHLSFSTQWKVVPTTAK